jgi:glutathione S-transferase
MKYPLVTLYTKENCSLCEAVKLELARLHLAYPHRLLEVDITQDRTLHAKFLLEIPVIQIGDVVLKGAITAVQLEAALQNGAN